MFSRIIAAVTLGLLAAACSARGNNEGATMTARSDSVFVEAFNDHFYEARIHAVYAGGHRHTLGTIAGNGGHSQTALLWEPRALVFEVSFIIDGSDYVSHPVDVSPGEIIEVRLPPNIHQSGFFRRVPRR
ncbi:MAG: hypothetical protein L0271_06390 [Gemmatimonadetes bacterium]|nr:hypothetical protein [Gemmatimonadota bacterium]